MNDLDVSDEIVTAVSERKIMGAWNQLAQKKGVFIKRAFASGFAALQQQIEGEQIDPDGKIIVVMLTGHGLKDPTIALYQVSMSHTLPVDVDVLDAFFDR